MIKSPLIENGETAFLKEISVQRIIDTYKTMLHVDVSKYFFGLNTISLLQCKKTGYKFFFPFDNILGDSAFYEKLQEFEWYYMPWKWEHDILFKEVQKRDKILEIGSGGLGFIKEMHQRGYDVTGLELNQKSVEKAQQLNLKLFPTLIEEFSKIYPNSFDIVCSFQVLEHISNVKSFLEASIEALRKGGKLIICVPNNGSFIKTDETLLMNYPPHHAGWWDEKSLHNLEKYFPITHIRTYYEPLQDYHIDWYVNLKLNRNILRRNLVGKTLLRKVYKSYIKNIKNNIKGHSICVVYQKL
jgi:2-polyprenyl-3-methyl-5-hydroxy-6-metoxy-1,4-benzoquinol methylase